MRPVLYGDVSSAARVLLGTAPDLRESLCRQMIGEAIAADRHRRHYRKPHPRWGNGSLMSAARRRRLSAEPGFDDPEYCACFELVLRCLRQRA